MKNSVLILICLSCFLSIKAQVNFYNPSEVREIKIYFYDDNWQYRLDSLFLADSKDRIHADLSIDGSFYENVGVRYKGYSSVNPGEKKNPFNIDLNIFVPGQSHNGIAKLKLGNVIHDPSFVREILSYEIARKYMPASEAGYAMVYANDSLIGLYANIQPVNGDFLEQFFGNDSNPFFKGNPDTLIYPPGSNANLEYYSGDSSSLFSFYSIESEYGWNDLNKFIYILNNETDSIEDYLNTDRALWMLAFDYALVNLDSYLAYAQNYYLYKDNNQQFNTIIWDLNMSFGSFRFADGGIAGLTGGLSVEAVKTINPLALLTYSISPRPLFKNLIQQSRYKNMYLAHIRTIIQENFENDWYISRGEELQAGIQSYVYADTNKFYQDSDFVDNFYEKVGGSGGMIEYPGIQDLMNARTTYLSGFNWFYDNPQILNNYSIPENPNPGNNVIFLVKTNNADSCFLYYRESNQDRFQTLTMFDDGNHNDSLASDGIFGVSLDVGIYMDYYFYVENTVAGTFSPERAAYEYHNLDINVEIPDIVINEFMAKNESYASDEFGQFDDWVEIFNNSSEDINLSDIYLSDNSEDLKKWAFPDTTISAGGYIVVWADNDLYQPGLHSGFQLSDEGESVVLSLLGTIIIDQIDYSSQNQDISYGRFPNGTGSFQFLPPSIGEENNPSGIEENSLDNEFHIFPNPAGDYVFIEVKDSDKDRKIEIFDLYGKKIMGKNIYTNQIRINISELNSGVYLVKIENKVEKLIVK